MGYQSTGVIHMRWHKVIGANSKLMLASRAFPSSLLLIKKTTLFTVSYCVKSAATVNICEFTEGFGLFSPHKEST